MKRKLLYLTSIILFSASSIKSQIKYIDLGGYTITASGYQSLASIADINTAFYGSATYASGQQVFTGTKTLGTVPYQFSAIGGTDTSGRIYSNVTGQTAYGTSPVTQPTLGGEFAPTSLGRLQYNGVGNTVRRQFSVSIPAGETVTIILMSDGASPAITYFSTSNTTAATFTNPSFTTSTTYAYKITNSTASTDTYTFWDTTGKLSIYRVYFADVTLPYSNPALGVNHFQADASSNVFSNGKLVFVSDVKSDTKVDVYRISGVLVKSFTTGSDTSFDLNTGIYVVKSKSAEGEKSAKILVN
jgi:hypothetical protein